MKARPESVSNANRLDPTIKVSTLSNNHPSKRTLSNKASFLYSQAQRNILNQSCLLENKGIIENYIIGRQIGQGSYAIVKEATHKTTGNKVAIKIYDKVKLIDPQRRRSVNNEINILKAISHPNLTKLYDSIDSKKQLYLVMEYAPGISLHLFAKSKPNRKFSEKEAKRIFYQAVEAINYCHIKGICHRDIKMDNIIINKDFRIKVIDFGFSTNTNQKLKIYCGTPSYMSPEIVTKSPYYGQYADIWALGILLYTLLAGYYPFKAMNDRELYHKIAKGVFVFPESISEGGKKLISRMLVVEPRKRALLNQVLVDSYFSENPENPLNSNDEMKKRIREMYDKEQV